MTMRAILTFLLALISCPAYAQHAGAGVDINTFAETPPFVGETLTA
jgi:hypothetical protein